MNLKSSQCRSSCGSRRKGATAVEFALVFPVIMIIFIGSIAVTQAFLVRDMTQLAAYEAAREATILDASPQQVQEKANQVLASMNLKDSEVTIIPEDFSNTTKEVEVVVVVPIRSNAWVTGTFLPPKWSVGSSITLRKSVDE